VYSSKNIIQAQSAYYFFATFFAECSQCKAILYARNAGLYVPYNLNEEQ